jgi:hypothetical protein
MVLSVTNMVMVVALLEEEEVVLEKTDFAMAKSCFARRILKPRVRTVDMRNGGGR